MRLITWLLVACLIIVSGAALSRGLYGIGGGNPLVAWWPFDSGHVNFGTNTVLDATNHNNNGTLNHIASGLPLTFNGTNSQIAMGSNPAFSMASFTVSAWVNFTSFTAGAFQTVVEHNRSASNWFGMYQSANGPYINWRATSSTSTNWDVTAVPLSPSTTYQVVGTYDAVKHQAWLYVNGLANGVVVAPPEAATLGPLTIGTDNTGLEPLGGTMPPPGVQIQSTAIPPSQVAAMYRRQTGAGPPVNVIYDNDGSNDPAHPGVQTFLRALQYAGFLNVLAMVTSASDPYAVSAMVAVNNTINWANSGIPIGAYQGNVSAFNDYALSLWDQQVVARFGTIPGDTRANYPAALGVLRRALAGAPDGSVVYISTGFQTNLAALLQSPPDGDSSLSGMQLVTRKVTKIVVMAGGYPSLTGEWNLSGDIAAAAYIFANAPVPIIGNGLEVGNCCIMGTTAWATATTDPYLYALQLGGLGLSRPIWNQVTVFYAAFGLGTFWTLSPPGDVVVTGSPGNATLTWTADPAGNVRYLIWTGNQSAGNINNFYSALYAAASPGGPEP